MVKGFGIVNKAEIDIFLELSCFINDPADVGNLISGSSSQVMLKISQARLNNMWTANVQIFKLVLEKAEEPEIKLPTFIGS